MNDPSHNAEASASHPSTSHPLPNDPVSTPCFVVFDSARQAVACGIGLQQAATRVSTPERPIRVGVGVHAGEPVPHDGQFIGSAVNVAARLAQNAAAGDLLISDTVRGLLRTSDLPPLVERAVTMKGVTDPPRAYSVEWRGIP